LRGSDAGFCATALVARSIAERITAKEYRRFIVLVFYVIYAKIQIFSENGRTLYIKIEAVNLFIDNLYSILIKQVLY
jgi:hypothetical protein